MRAMLPHLAPERLPGAVAFARRAVCGFLTARPKLIRPLPSTETRRGGAWPPPRSWEAALTLPAFATAARVSRDVPALVVHGAVGDGAGLDSSPTSTGGTCPVPRRCRPTRPRPSCPGAATCGRPHGRRWSPPSVRGRSARGGRPAAAVLARALRTGSYDLLVAPAKALAAPPGGTDLRSGSTRAVHSRPRPDVVVALTDGLAPWPSGQPPCRTAVCLFHRPRRVRERDPDDVPGIPPPWARVVPLG